jgi:hypothetical protein
MKRWAALALALAGAAAFAQAGDDQRACALARQASESGDAVMQATYANCLLIGVLREPKALAHARDLARASMKQGSEIGAFALYAAFTADPAYGFMKDGKPDMDRYHALAAQPVESRTEQVEALEALGFAYAKKYPKAMLSLSAYYYETVAPKNVIRVRNLAATMLNAGMKSPWLDQFHKQGAHVASLGDTKASVRAFLDAQKAAALAAGVLLAKEGGHCDTLKLTHVQSGDLKDAVFLPLKSPALHDTYLVKGTWDETWRFEGCGRQVDVPLHFAADGWGGATFHT